jgi:hypothetical protein
MRTREGMKTARAKGRLRGKQPKLSARQEAHLASLHAAGEHTISELEELFSVTRSTVYRALAGSRARASARDSPSIGSCNVGWSWPFRSVERERFFSPTELPLTVRLTDRVPGGVGAWDICFPQVDAESDARGTYEVSVQSRDL